MTPSEALNEFRFMVRKKSPNHTGRAAIAVLEKELGLEDTQPPAPSPVAEAKPPKAPKATRKAAPKAPKKTFFGGGGSGEE